MKTKHLVALVAICCAVAALAGCASTDRSISRSSLDDKDLERAEAPSPTGLSQPVVPDERAFRKQDLGINRAVTESRHFDTNITSKADLSALDENDAQINVTEFATQAVEGSHLHPMFGRPEETNYSDFSWDRQEFHPQGLRFFTIPF